MTWRMDEYMGPHDVVKREHLFLHLFCYIQFKANGAMLRRRCGIVRCVMADYVTLLQHQSLQLFDGALIISSSLCVIALCRV